jgi:hypothetical protein
VVLHRVACALERPSVTANEPDINRFVGTDNYVLVAILERTTGFEPATLTLAIVPRTTSRTKNE